ncbi:hypothetical protein HZH68_012353 [Vespula germanica]|uniref:C2H2-type domain-containing protein n=1 Tax=Vespula germanica TaxID=30212 RepID=A0A834JN63_VESGE|nr:hypothetical protein HZH68_012353 [Vespula germanica]
MIIFNDSISNDEDTIDTATTTYSSSNWTVPTLPSTSRVVMYTRCLRSMTLTDDHERTRIWGSRKYICNDCQKTFALKASLVRHKMFECNNKGQRDRQSTSQKQNLLQSSSNGHSSATTISATSSSTSKTITTNIIERRRSTSRHACPKCNRSYAFFTSLWRHQHYECGVEPQFICPICKAKFAQKSNLDRHIVLCISRWPNALIILCYTRRLQGFERFFKQVQVSKIASTKEESTSISTKNQLEEYFDIEI